MKLFLRVYFGVQLQIDLAIGVLFFKNYFNRINISNFILLFLRVYFKVYTQKLGFPVFIDFKAVNRVNFLCDICELERKISLNTNQKVILYKRSGFKCSFEDYS